MQWCFALTARRVFFSISCFEIDIRDPRERQARALELVIVGINDIAHARRVYLHYRCMPMRFVSSDNSLSCRRVRQKNS